MRKVPSVFAFFAGLGLALSAVMSSTPGYVQSTWDTIQQNKVLRVGAAQAEPWFLKDPQSGKWSGFGISLAEHLASDLGVGVEFVEVTWGTAIAALQAKKIDIMPLLDATPKRAVAVDFPSTPLIYSALAVLARDGLNVKDWEDLNTPDVTISVTMGSTIDSYITQHTPKANILRYPTNSEAVAAFQSGRADAASLFVPPLIALQKKIGRGNIILPSPIRPMISSIALRKEDDKRMRDWLDTAISWYYNTGQTQQWFEEFLVSRGIDPKTVPAVQRELWPRN